MTLSERILDLSAKGVDIETITMVLRAEGLLDSEIRAGYDRASVGTTTEIVRGQYYIRRRTT